MHKNIFRTTWLLFTLVLLLTGCGGKQAVQTIFQKRTPYEAYAHNLREANLHKTALGQAWISAGQKALQDSILIKLPYQETGYFKADKPSASSYTFMAREGEMIEVKVTTRTNQDIRLFLDLFEVGSLQPRETRHVAAADTTNLHMEYKADNNLPYLVRLQPELLQSGSYTITIITKPSLAFPVQGKNSSAIQSFWGADRDNGSRLHEGVDIFAPKGTPAIAAARGIITRVDETPRGGKVVWLTDTENRQSIYYAHLDKQLVQPGQKVNIGDTLGLVGNTGNARSTPAHLHFGIYTFGRGAIDPYPFIYDANQKPEKVKVNEKYFGEWGRTAKNNTFIRRSPEAKAETVSKLPKNAAVLVLAGTQNWYKVQLPNGAIGFLHKDNFAALTKPIETQSLKADTELTESPNLTASPVAALKKDTKVSVLGFFEAFQLVRLADGTLGWLKS
ncbi:M23 family metallopeptidase [Adhaeribacter soli]|uniref:M23 family metallopeptidase n=1 Tax=Adhaeribacter soli TaxID=2607655 RepID=A0A5N1IIX3_9BACT|nr:M23 family metallopeptidase [Adhaeribacter soli]KAA9325615.1 M23 family metallopeptidase [Adhaeribacter soli]